MSRLLPALARMLAVLLLGSFLAATLVRFAPGFGVDEDDLDARLSEASHAALRNSEAAESLPHFYVRTLGNLLHGDLGQSQSFDEPIAQLLRERLPATALTLAFGLALAWTLGFGLALAAVLEPRASPRASLLAGACACTPAAVLAFLCVVADAPARIAVGLIVFPRVYQFARALLLDCAALPHVLTARALGAGSVRVLLRHILPVAAPQLLSVIGISVSMALAASIPVEALCDLPGIGQLAWKAALSRDLVLLVDLTMIVTVLTLAANIGSDLLAGSLRGGRA